MANNKLIAKNTIILYFRLLITMAIGLYSSRVVLEQLGVNAYGVYNVVGGVVILVAFINSAMTNATQRFINFEIGTGNTEKLKQVLSASVIIHFALAIIIGLIAESVGPWIINEYLNIPKELLSQANVVYHLSVLSFLIGIITAPYTALVIAYEKMSIFAISSIIESVLKLLSAISLFFIDKDRLAYYGLFICISTLIAKGLYYIYCIRTIKESKHLNWAIDKKLAKELVSFSGWSVLGGLGYILHTQGIAVIINIFFTSAINATQGIANQVNGLVNSFLSSFIIALNPQIVQTYASGDYEEMHKLVYRGCRLAIFLTSVIVIPIIIECNGLLAIWLTVIPPFSTGFVVVVLIIALVNSITAILSTAQNATGNIKKYQVVLTSIGLLHLPLVIIAFMWGLSPLWSVYVYLIITIVLQIYRIYYVSKSTGLSLKYFYHNVVFKSVLAILMGSVIPLFCAYHLPDNVYSTIINVIIAFGSISCAFIFLVLSSYERNFITEYLKSKVCRNYV